MAKSNILNLKTPKKDNTHHYFIAGDLHDFACDEPTLDIMLKHAKLLPRKDRHLILNGDINDFPEFMDHNKKLASNAKNTDMIEEFYHPAFCLGIEWGKSLLSKCLSVFDAKNIVVVEGNHEARLRYFQGMIPNRYRHDFDWFKALNLKELGIKHIQYNQWIDIGHVSITHGMYHGNTALKRHYEAAGRSVIFNHVHQVASQSFVRRGDTVRAWSNPCMCKMNPPYLRGSENNWTMGYGHLLMRSTGQFNYNVHTVYDDKLILSDGKELIGEALHL